MAFFDRVQFTPSGTPGTGNFVVDAAVAGFRTPAGASVPNGNLSRWLAIEGTAWEIFHGAYTTGDTTVARTTLIASSTGSAVSFTSAARVSMLPSATEFLNMEVTDVASGGTTNIGAAATNFVNITGTTTITAFDTVRAGIYRFAVFAGALTLTHNGTSLILPSGANITTAAGDTALFVSLGSGNWRCLYFQKAAASALPYGRQPVYIDALQMLPRATNGAAPGEYEQSTNKTMLDGLDFDASTIEYAQFRWKLPKQWDEGTVTFKPVWAHGSTATNFKVSWGLQAVALSDDDAGDAAFGTAQYSNDTGGTTRDIYVGPESSAITIAGTPAEGDWVIFQVLRKADDGTNDTLAVDATLLGIELFVTTNAGNDA